MDTSYDRLTDILSVRAMNGDPKYVIVARGTVVIFADDEGIWGLDVEAESWDVENIEEILKKIKVEII